jgi:catechol 2,3-dioxygenase-like lactoylglutathione lyase family enzyme
VSLVGSHHVGFTVSDLDRSIDWYSTLLAAEPLVRETATARYMGEMLGYPDCQLEYAYFALPGEAKLELLQYLEPPPDTVSLETYNVGNGHLCLIVDDIHAEFDRLRTIATFRSSAPVEIDAGPNRGGWSVYLRDPDGITIQLFQPSLG